MRWALFFAVMLSAVPGLGQWKIVTPAPTTADLRGIDNVGGGVAWASGTEGTVLRTVDGGTAWKQCAVPPGAEHLDFRGVQAFDANTALVMSSGKGDLSRLYKTTDGCQTWKLVFTNPDKDGFWDAMRMDEDGAEIVGDSVIHVLVSEATSEIVPVWSVAEEDDPVGMPSDHFFELRSEHGEGGFAASNSILAIGKTPHLDPIWSYQWLATQTADHSYVHREAVEETPTCEPCRLQSVRVETPMGQHSESAGIFSLGFREDRWGIAVGGDYKKPESGVKAATYSSDAGLTWNLSNIQPHGFRSAVAYDEAAKAWITVGPNGTDVSADDGRNWSALKPDAKFNEAPDADQHWNALSLPFVVGPHGRIGILREGALPAAKP